MVSVERRIEQVSFNLERWRRLSLDLGERYIIVNTSAFELQVQEGDYRHLEMRVIAGRQGRPTAVYMRYQTTWVGENNNAVQFRENIYRRDEGLLAALHRGGAFEGRRLISQKYVARQCSRSEG